MLLLDATETRTIIYSLGYKWKIINIPFSILSFITTLPEYCVSKCLYSLYSDSSIIEHFPLLIFSADECFKETILRSINRAGLTSLCCVINPLVVPVQTIYVCLGM